MPLGISDHNDHLESGFKWIVYTQGFFFNHWNLADNDAIKITTNRQ